MIVTFPAAARLRAARRSARSISRGLSDTVLSVSGRQARCQRRANHHDPAMAAHLPAGEPGFDAKVARPLGTCPRFKRQTCPTVQGYLDEVTNQIPRPSWRK